MPLRSDEQGFLVGEPLARADVLDVLEGIRDEIKALRRDLSEQHAPASSSRLAPSAATRERSSSAAPVTARRAQQAHAVPTREKRSGQAPSVTVVVAPAGRPHASAHAQANASARSSSQARAQDRAMPSAQPVAQPRGRAAQAAAQPRDARGRFLSREPLREAAIQPPPVGSVRRNAEPAQPLAAQTTQASSSGATADSRPHRASNQPAAHPVPRYTRDKTGRLRDENGRFITRSQATPRGHGDVGGEGGSRVLGQSDGDSSGIADAISGVGDRLRAGLTDLNEGAKGADPVVTAANEIAQPLSRGFQMIFGQGQRSQNRWFRRFWGHLRKDKRDDDLEQKRQRKILKNIERKPVGGDQGSGLWRLLLMMLGPLLGLGGLLTGLLAAVIGLPALIAGAVLKGLGALLSLLGLKALGGRMSAAGGRIGRPASTRAPLPGRTDRAASTRAPPVTTGRGGQPPQGRGAPPVTGQPPRAGAVGRFGRGLSAVGRRIPGLGALLTLGMMGSEVAASEGSEATREDKDRMTGRAIGGGVGALGGMAAGGAAGAAVGSVVPVIGTVVGGVVGSIAGAYFAGSAGEEVGEHVGGWVNELRGSDLVAQLSETWQWTADFTSALFAGVGEWMRSSWEGVTASISSSWSALSTAVSEQWSAITAGISERWSALTTGVSERWNQVIAGIGDRWESLAKGFESLKAGAIEAAKAANRWIEDKTGVNVAGTARKGAEWVADTAGKARDVAVDTASSANTWIEDKTGVNVAETVSSAATTTVEAVKDTAVHVAERTREVATSAVETTAETLSRVYDDAQDYASKAIDRASEAAAEAAESAKEAAKEALKATSEAATSVWGALKRWGEDTMDAAKARVDEAKNEANAKRATRQAESGGVAAAKTNESQDAFLKRVYDEALARTGNHEEAVAIASQAALETGYGKSAPGNNYFGIKGEGGATTQTKEFRDGKWVTESATWEGYKDLGDSIDGRQQFLERNPRYRNAGYYEAQTAEEKFAALKRAGYATDPNYVSKNTSIAARVRQLAGGEQVAAPGEVSGDARIVDATGDMDKYGYGGWGDLSERKAFIVHHTGGRGDTQGIQRVFGERGVGTQYVIDRDGATHRTLPEGAKGQHIRGDSAHMTALGKQLGLNNSNTEGVEIIAKDDSDVTPAQREAAQQLVKTLGYTPDQVFGHGEINTHKQKTEGMTTVNAIRAARDAPSVAQPPKAPTTQPSVAAPQAKPDAVAAETPDNRAQAGFEQSQTLLGKLDEQLRDPALPPDARAQLQALRNQTALMSDEFQRKAESSSAAPSAKPTGASTHPPKPLEQLTLPKMPTISGSSMRAPTAISVPKLPQTVAAPQEISVPLNSPTTRDPTDSDGGFAALGEVTRDLSDRRLAHIVTGSYSHAGVG